MAKQYRVSIVRKEYADVYVEADNVDAAEAAAWATWNGEPSYVDAETLEIEELK